MCARGPFCPVAIWDVSLDFYEHLQQEIARRDGQTVVRRQTRKEQDYASFAASRTVTWSERLKQEADRGA